MADDTVVVDDGKWREIHALKGVKTSGTLFSRPGTDDSLAVEDDRNPAGFVIQGVQDTLIDIQLGVGIRISHGFLRSGKNDRLPGVLDQIG